MSISNVSISTSVIDTPSNSNQKHEQVRDEETVQKHASIKPSTPHQDGQIVTVLKDLTITQQKLVIPGITTHHPIRSMMTPDGIRNVVCLSGAENVSTPKVQMTDVIKVPPTMIYHWGNLANIDISKGTQRYGRCTNSQAYAVLSPLYQYHHHNYIFKLVAKVPITASATLYVSHNPEHTTIPAIAALQLNGFQWDIKACEEVYVKVPYFQTTDVAETTVRDLTGTLAITPLHPIISATDDPIPYFIRLYGVPTDVTFWARRPISTYAKSELQGISDPAFFVNPAEDLERALSKLPSYDMIDSIDYDQSPPEGYPTALSLKGKLTMQPHTSRVLVKNLDTKGLRTEIIKLPHNTMLVLQTASGNSQTPIARNDFGTFTKFETPQAILELVLHYCGHETATLHYNIQLFPSKSLTSSHSTIILVDDSAHLLSRPPLENAHNPPRNMFNFKSLPVIDSRQRLESTVVVPMAQDLIDDNKFIMSSANLNKTYTSSFDVTAVSLPVQLSLPCNKHCFITGTPQLHFKIQATPFHNVKLVVAFTNSAISQTDVWAVQHIILDSKNPEMVVSVPWLSEFHRLTPDSKICKVSIFTEVYGAAATMSDAELLIFASIGNLKFLDPLVYKKLALSGSISVPVPAFETQSLDAVNLPSIKQSTQNDKLPAVISSGDIGTWEVFNQFELTNLKSSKDISLSPITYPSHVMMDLDRHLFYGNYPNIKITSVIPNTTSAVLWVSSVPHDYVLPDQGHYTALPHKMHTGNSSVSTFQPIWYHAEERLMAPQMNQVLLFRVLDSTSFKNAVWKIGVTVWIDTSNMSRVGLQSNAKYQTVV